MFERFTSSASRTVVLAQEEARALNHNYVGTEHLLLALSRDEGPAGQALNESGVTREAARGQVVQLIGAGISLVTGHIAFTPQARTVLINAVRTALASDDDHVAASHLLKSLITDDPSTVPVAALAITHCGASADTIREHLATLMADTEPDTLSESPFTLSA